jgi:hypothetical protein
MGPKLVMVFLEIEKELRKIFNFQLSTTVKMPPETWNPIILFFWKPRTPSQELYLTLLKYPIRVGFFWDLNKKARSEGLVLTQWDPARLGYHLQLGLATWICSDFPGEIQPELMANSHFNTGLEVKLDPKDKVTFRGDNTITEIKI